MLNMDKIKYAYMQLARLYVQYGASVHVVLIFIIKQWPLTDGNSHGKH